MTANVLLEDHAACMNAGMHDFVSKPIRIADLVAVLERFRLNSSRDAEGEPPTASPTA